LAGINPLVCVVGLSHPGVKSSILELLIREGLGLSIVGNHDGCRHVCIDHLDLFGAGIYILVCKRRLSLEGQSYKDKKK
jgi:hypothetical protein